MKHSTKKAKEERTGPYDYQRHWSQVKTQPKKTPRKKG